MKLTHEGPAKPNPADIIEGLAIPFNQLIATVEAPTDFGVDHFPYRCDAGGQNHVTARAVTNPAMGIGQHANFLALRVHHMSKPDIVAGPAKALHIWQRAHAEQFFTKSIFIDGFGQMGVQVNPGVTPCKRRGVTH